MRLQGITSLTTCAIFRGGPLPTFHRKGDEKNRTFLFWSQEFRRIIICTTLQATVPTDAMKSGTLLNAVCVDYTGNTCNATSKQITNINPVAVAYIKDVWSKIPAEPGGLKAYGTFAVNPHPLQ